MGIGGLLNRMLTNYSTGGGLLAGNPEAELIAKRNSLMGFGQNLLKLNSDAGMALEAGADRGLKAGFAAKGQQDERARQAARVNYLGGGEEDVGERYDNAIERAFAANDIEGVRSLVEMGKSIGRGSTARNPNRSSPYKIGYDPSDPEKTPGYFKLDGGKATKVEGIAPYNFGATGGRGPGSRLIDIWDKDGYHRKIFVDNNTELSQFDIWTAPTDVQNRATVHANLIASANDALKDATAPNRLEWLAQKFGVQEAIGKQRQEMDAAGIQVIDAYLRATTGAAYNKEEMRNAKAMLVPQPGDSDELLRSKETMRQSLEDNIVRTAEGRRWVRPEGVTNELWSEIVRIRGTKPDMYLDRSGQNAAPELVNGIDPASVLP